jgi:hypothetical protein
MTHSGVINLVEMLKINETKTDLLLYDNELTDEGVQHLLYFLKK